MSLPLKSEIVTKQTFGYRSLFHFFNADISFYMQIYQKKNLALKVDEGDKKNIHLKYQWEFT